ncbi:hypothetical protein DERF_009862 [Dermatophagoides farinae]|uniref:Uncharacterized protein n=1 Tax=Dermatophagoides farinae TaxID=6954 RepID=A0A922HVY6_DERFA|nr:hypothetical protein DERF_009862 [Dermatophagoides farinae]
MQDVNNAIPCSNQVYYAGSRSATTNKKYKPDTTSQQEFINTDLSLSISIHPTTNEIITHPTVGSPTSERKWHYKI